MKGERRRKSNDPTGHARFGLVALAVVLSACSLPSSRPDNGLDVQVSTQPADAEQVSRTLEQNDGDSALKGVPESCPLILPGEVAFTPASQTPDSPPSVYGVVWYGTPDLWTMIDPDGEINSRRWLEDDKTFWWSKLYLSEDPSEISLTAEQLNGSAPSVHERVSAGRGFNPFMSVPTHESVTMVGVELPEPGCWELTAEYKGATLSYVVWFR